MVIIYEARVRFETRVQMRDSANFEKGRYRCDGTQQLKNYVKYFYLYFLFIFTIKIFLKNTLDSQNKERRQKTQNKKENTKQKRNVLPSHLIMPYQIMHYTHLNQHVYIKVK